MHLTQLEVYLNARAEIEYLQSLPLSAGGVRRGDDFFFGYDLRPSSVSFVAEEGRRGELAQAIERAIRDAGMKPVNLGCLPTPALAFHAFERRKGSMMVTGSHIPAAYNGYKTNTATGELSKADEAPITGLAEQFRKRLYEQPAAESPFDSHGQFKSGHVELSPETRDARDGYFRRYADFFAGSSLAGKRILVYQHSAVGRDLLVEMLRHFGAEVVPAGRCEIFVPIDTENVDGEQLARVQALVNEAWAVQGPLDAVVSTDGDSDRPMIFALERPAAGVEGTSAACARFLPGDLVGMIVAEYLRADAVVVPITCNDAIDRGPLKNILEPKTRIGSPFVIAGLEAARGKGRTAVCGWEPNGGFLTGTDIHRNERTLRALPTRDAMLPILSVLFCATEQKLSLCEMFDRLPKRFGRAGLLRNVPRETGHKIIQQISPFGRNITEVRFRQERVVFLDARRVEVARPEGDSTAAKQVRETLACFFTPALGFGLISKLDYTDGVRIGFDNGDIAHVRPSGNADELRIYGVADSPTRAEAIVQAGIAEPDGILRKLEAAVS